MKCERHNQTAYSDVMNMVCWLSLSAEAVQCMWIQRDPLRSAWVDHQPFNYQLSCHPGKTGDACLGLLCAHLFQRNIYLYRALYIFWI